MKIEYAQQLLSKVRDDYNEIAEEFSKTRSGPWPEIQFVFDHYLQKGDKVLDLGCGNGRFLPAIRERGGRYFGIDNSTELIKIAQSRYPNENFQVADALDLPFANNFFDQVYCIAVLHHIPSKDLRLKALKQIKKVLKPGGNLILTVWQLKSKGGLNLLFELSLILKYVIGRFIFRSGLDFRDVFEWWGKKTKRYYHCFSQNELVGLVEEAGFELVKSGIVSNARSNRNNIYLIAKKQ